jgi:hypothetical protein
MKAAHSATATHALTQHHKRKYIDMCGQDTNPDNEEHDQHDENDETVSESERENGDAFNASNDVDRRVPLPAWFISEQNIVDRGILSLLTEPPAWENHPFPHFYENEHGVSPYTLDPRLQHITTLSMRDFYNFGDARFQQQAPGAAAARKYFQTNMPFAEPSMRPVVAGAPSSVQPRLRTTQDIDADALHRLVTLYRRMPLEEREPAGKILPEQPRRVKQRVTQVPGPEERVRMWIDGQHTPAWFDSKAVSDGATTLAIVLGVSKFDSNDNLWQKEHGLISQGEQCGEDLFPLYHGTHFETETCWIVAMVLGLFSTDACGMIPDPYLVHSRMSPDRLTVVPPWIAWNHWMLQQRRRRYGDFLRRLLIEAKSPIHGVYTFGEISPAWVYRHYVPVMYRSQTTDQMFKADLEGNLFSAYWHMNEKSPMRRVAGTDAFLVSEVLVTLILHNDAYVAIAHAALKDHATRKTCPPRRKPGDFKMPALTMLPIMHVRFFICGRDPAASDFLGQCHHMLATPPSTSRVGAPYANAAAAATFQPPTYSCVCCKPLASHGNVHRLAVPWTDVQWTQRERADPNVGPRPTNWPTAWFWPPRMGSHIEWFHNAEPVVLESVVEKH